MADKNALFSDVIKNISRVNTVLQELIQNYEQLQKIYKSHSFESTQTDSVESDIDEAFKNAKGKNRSKDKDNETRKEIIYSQNRFPATQMFLSEEETVQETTEQFQNTDAEEELPEIEATKTNRTKIVNILRSSSDSDDTNENKVKEVKEVIHRNHRHSDEVKVPDHVFFDNVHKDIKNKIRNSNPTGLNYKKTARIKPKYRGKIRNNTSTSPTFRKFSPNTTTIRDSSKNVLHVLQSEDFPEDKIWKNIADKTPINLGIHRKTINFERDMGIGNRDIYSKSRVKWKKPALLILTSNLKVSEVIHHN